MMMSPHPFTIKRMAKPGSSYASVPMVISCKWAEIKIENVFKYAATNEDMIEGTGCYFHPGERCMGHHMTNRESNAFLIPYGFATPDEMRFNDRAALNSAVFNGDKNKTDVANFCFDALAKKNGILRKQCNSARPTNSFRFVASPSRGPTNTIWLPKQIFDKGTFLFMGRDGYYKSVKMKEGDPVVFGRCPSQGKNSALPMIVRMSDTDSMRVPLDICKLNNTDFDGDEDWGLACASEDAREQLFEAVERVWGDGAGIFEELTEIGREHGSDDTIDPAMYTTMPFEDMESHSGGRAYELLMLKPTSWKAMTAVMIAPSYWTTWVSRSADGIRNNITGKHGIGKPYVDMRNCMMMGSIVNPVKNIIRIACKNMSPIPVLKMDSTMGMAACSSGLTKMTVSMYQKGIDTAKHGTVTEKLSAVDSILSDTENCYAITNEHGRAVVRTVRTLFAETVDVPYTKMSYIVRATSPEEMLDRAVWVVSMIEELDDIHLTDEERIAVSVFFAFMSTRTSEILSDNMVESMRGVGADWYTSAMCTNIGWIKNVIRNGYTSALIDKSTSINSILGSILLGNMSMIVPTTPTSDTIVNVR